MFLVSANPYRTPVLPIWFEIQTYGGLPVKRPLPPRTCVVPLPKRSQFKPTRGDQYPVVLGRAPELYLTGAPS